MRRHAKSLVRVLTLQLGRENVRFGAEIGVWRGELSADLLRSFPDLYLFMIDLWEPIVDSSMHDKDNSIAAMHEAMEAAHENTAFAADRRQLWKGASTVEAAGFSDRAFDFVFLDADHFYESTRPDLHAWWPKVRDGGIMAGHDYNGVGDRRKGWGVKRAVDEFFGQFGLEVHVESGLVWWARKEVK